MKRRVVLDRPKFESSFINETKDFNFILSQLNLTKPQQKPFYSKGWFITTVASFIGFISFVVLFL